MTGESLIAGRWRGTGETFSALSPVTGEELPVVFSSASASDAREAMQAAAEAFEFTRRMSAAGRARLLRAVADEIVSLGEPLLDRANQETALPMARLSGERDRTVNQLRMFADLAGEGSWVDAVIDTPDPERKPQPRPDIRRMKAAIGPVAVFDAGNFPFAFGVCGGDFASAVAAGNPVVVKAHPGHPGTDELFARAVLAALTKLGVPPSAFSMLQSREPALSLALVCDPHTAAVGFTGSLVAGRALFDAAAGRDTPIPVYAEMGSVNPVVILPKALEERSEAIAQGLSQSITLGNGQFCTKPGLIFVIEAPETQNFVNALRSQLDAVQPGDMLASRIRNNFVKISAAQAQHASHAALLEPQPQGYAQTSSSLLQVTSDELRDEARLQDEAFGPGAIVVICKSQADLVSALRVLKGQLTGTVHTGRAESPEDALPVVEELRQKAGRVIFNGYPTGVEVGRAMVHGGPYPAATPPQSTSVGTAAVERFTRPVCFQDAPDAMLPLELQNANPLGIERMVDGQRTRGPIT